MNHYLDTLSENEKKQLIAKVMGEAKATGRNWIEIAEEHIYNFQSANEKIGSMVTNSIQEYDMSFISTIVVAEGVVMAADSAYSMLKMVDVENIRNSNFDKAVKSVTNGQALHNPQDIIGSHIVSRSVQKLWVMKKCPIAISSGNECITRNTGASIKPHIEYFVNNNCYYNPREAAIGLMHTIQEIDPTIGAKFHICGYPKDALYPEFYFISIAENKFLCVAEQGSGGFSFCAANDYFSPYVPMINQNAIHFTLQDAIDLSLFAFDMSMKLERFIKLEQHITPPVDLLVIKPDGIEWVQKKELRGEK
ncbi:MAG: hypothetical protein FWB86_13355 [Treponema sp.]|nr:hypothetical protein [Treponema sp.]